MTPTSWGLPPGHHVVTIMRDTGTTATWASFTLTCQCGHRSFGQSEGAAIDAHAVHIRKVRWPH